MQRATVPKYGRVKRQRSGFQDALLAQRPVFVERAVGQAQHVGTQVGGNQHAFALEQQGDVACAVAGRVNDLDAAQQRQHVAVAQLFFHGYGPHRVARAFDKQLIDKLIGEARRERHWPATHALFQQAGIVAVGIHAGVDPLLDVGGAARVVGVQMSKDDALDSGRVLARLVQGREDFVGAARQARVNQRQAVVLDNKGVDGPQADLVQMAGNLFHAKGNKGRLAQPGPASYHRAGRGGVGRNEHPAKVGPCRRGRR